MDRNKLKTIFRVETILLEVGRYPVRKTYTIQYGYFTSLEKAIQWLPLNEGLYTKEILFFIITEIILNRVDIDWFDFNSVRIYNADGKLIDKVDCDDEMTYHGRTEDEVKFHIGDIVEVFDYFENKIRLGIVARLPYTAEEVAKFHKEHDGIKLTMDNDKYGICFLDNGFKLVTAVLVMAPFKKVTKSLQQKLKAKLEQYNKEKSNHKK